MCGGGEKGRSLEEVCGGVEGRDEMSCLKCGMSWRNDVHSIPNRFGYHEYVEPPPPEKSFKAEGLEMMRTRLLEGESAAVILVELLSFLEDEYN